MIEWLILVIKISALIIAGLFVMGLVGLSWAMTFFTWERFKDFWRKNR